MLFNTSFFKNAGINPGISSDLSFVIYDGKTKDLISKYNSRIPNSKSNGSIQTLLEMHALMSRSLSIISPGVIFTPDFPDYLLSQDDPKYMETVPVIDSELYKNMPHYRNDLFERNFDEYGSVPTAPAPHITWGCVRSEPGTVSGPPFRGTQEIKPRDRELIMVFDKEYLPMLRANSDGKLIESNQKIYKYIAVKGQFFDNLVQYNTWTRTSWEAEELTDWFQKEYMTKYVGMFRESGINQLIFSRRVRDDILMQIKNRYHLRSILYYIRTEQILNDTIMPISRIDVDLDVLSSASDFIINKELSDYYTNILDRWHFK